MLTKQGYKLSPVDYMLLCRKLEFCVSATFARYTLAKQHRMKQINDSIEKEKEKQGQLDSKKGNSDGKNSSPASMGEGHK